MIILDQEEVAATIGLPFQQWAHRCHEISLAVVRSGLIPPSRVARGQAKGLISQHSWVVIGDDCYDTDAEIIDPTLWSYVDDVDGIWYGTLKDGRHFPHGGESEIWEYGKPPSPIEPPIEITVESHDAKLFLKLCGPLDRRGWAFLAHAPVKGWPAAEIIAAMDDNPALSALIPIDRLGMLTDRNPNNLYR